MGKLYLFVFFLMIAGWWSYKQYEAIEKFYPGLTYWDYFMLSDKLRITPAGN